MGAFVKKNGLVYSEDSKTVVGVDGNSAEFQGTIPYGPVCIEDEVFEECPYVKFSMPDSVKSLGKALFRNSKYLTTVKLPLYVTELPPYLFAGCTALTRVNMPNELTSLPEGLFYNCLALQDVPFRNGIRELPPKVLAGCKSLKSLIIPPSVKIIRRNAVANCTQLFSLVLPSDLVELEDGAFDGCVSLHSIRISDSNRCFYVSDEDRCLYERTAAGDKLRLRGAGVQSTPVKLYKEDVDAEDDEFYSDEGLFEEDDSDFSAAVGQSDSEEQFFESVEDDNLENEIQISNEEKETIMADSNMDDLLADIIGGEKERRAEGEKVAISADELDSVFSEPTVEEQHEAQPDAGGVSGKAKILIDSVKFSKIIDCEPSGEPPLDSDLFVVAERTEAGADGQEGFSAKLEACVRKFAAAQDYKRIFLLYGLPVENDEFMQFYYHFMSGRNIVFATEAASPSKLSDYGRAVCENSRISLDRDELLHQRKQISIKNNNLVKLVIQDLYS